MDPIADMFTRIRNASAVGKPVLSLPMSKLKYEVAKILANEGWIKRVEVIPGGLAGKHNNFDELRLYLKYKKNGKSQISSIQRVSRPGLRIYVSKSEIPTVLNNFGTAIISTSRGLMTGAEAKKQKIGGEVIGEIF
ncbi:MAG: small subunit ribosomal protein [Patescibacteria group bacterium]|nr:small subunit ribosomal protein [Patescibacteria group bacterium]